MKQTLADEFKSENSVWVYYSGKHIHFRFLTLGTEDELRRIVLSLIRYGSKGSLTQNVGRVVATAPDKARIIRLAGIKNSCCPHRFGMLGGFCA